MSVQINGTIVIDDTSNLKNLTSLSVFEKKIALAAGTGSYAIDLATGSYFTKTISGATTFTVTNVPAAGSAASFIIELVNGGSATITWGTGFTSMKWANGTAPALTTSGTDIIGLYTHDGGATWRGVLLAKDSK